jgi:hypothetical protein
MQTCAQKQNQSQKPVSSSLARPKKATPGPNHREHPILYLQRIIGNQAVQRMLQTHAEECETGLTGPESPRLGTILAEFPYIRLWQERSRRNWRLTSQGTNMSRKPTAFLNR